jgi:Bacterial antitoxin of type II TA system, VapB
MAKELRGPTHRTTLNLPVDLLREAEAIVGTSSPTEAVVVALETLVAQRHLRELLDMDLPDLTPEALDEMRRPRFRPEDA